jgi:hypothetical protein
VALMRAWALAAVFVIAVIWARALTSANAELQAAAGARAAGRIDEAIERYQYALRWYTPGGEAPVQAARALDAIASEALARGDRATAIDALQRLRGGVRATYGYPWPLDDRLRDADRRLADVLAQQQVVEGAPLEQIFKLRNARLRELRRWHAAPLGASLLIVIAFAAWLGGAVFTLWRGLDRDARWVPRYARGGALWTVAWFALWVLGLWQA